MTFWATAWLWIKSKWKALIAFLVSLLTLLLVLARGRQQKKVLKVANESHEKENEINDKARKDLTDGLSSISTSKDDKIKEVITESDEAARELADEKTKFVSDAASSKDLGKKIADKLGMEFVDADEE